MPKKSQEPPSVEPSLCQSGNGLLFCVCSYISELEGFLIDHPRRHVQVASDEVQEWMDGLAEHSEIVIKKIELQDNWWRSFTDPYVVFEKESGKPCAAIPSKGKQPAQLIGVENQNQTLLDSATASNIHPYAYVFYKTLPEKTSGIQDIVRFCFHGLKGEIALLVALLGFLGIVRLFFPLANQLLFDHVIPHGDFKLFWQLACALAITLLAEFALSLARGFSILRLQVLAESKMQAALWERLMNLPFSIFRQYTIGDLREMVRPAEKIRPLIAGKTLYTICDTPFAIFLVVLMLIFSIELGLITVALLVFFVCIAWMLRKKIQPLINESLDKETDLLGFLNQLPVGITTLRIAGAENRMYAQWAGRFADLEKLKCSIRSMEKYFTLIQGLYVVIILAVLYGFLGYHLNETGSLPFSLTIGAFIGFQTAFLLLTTNVNTLFEFMGAALNISRICNKTNAILTCPPEQTKGKHYEEKLRGEIRVENLCFRYPGNSALTLSNVSFRCAPGKFVGIIGRSGSGKSTVLRCMMALEKPEDGHIYYDGHRMEDLNVHTMRRRIGAVLQESHIFIGNVKSNLLVGRHASRQAIDRALELSCFDEVVRRLPMGLKTFVAPENNSLFSNGELQRLLIARALLTDIDILLLDEATSALDAATQSTVMKNIASLKITCVVVAHRLETIRNADQILVIHEGKIERQGTFKELGLEDQDSIFGKSK